MQENDLHKLGKTDLLTLIYKQEKQIQQLTKEVEELKQQLEDRTIKMKEAGSIAEASLKINKIFEVAQQAADEYLKSIKEVNKPSHECAQINGNPTKDEAESENTYEDQTNDKISKELVLVNNELMVIKPKLLRRVVIFLMYISVKISVFMKWSAKKIQFFTKKVKLNAKINFIKFKHDIIKIIECIKSIYDKIEKHMVGFCKYCKLQFPATMSTISYKIFVGKRKLKAITKKVVKLSIEKLKSGALLVAKIVRRLCVETYYIIIKSCKIVKLIRFKAIRHMKGFIQYCNLQFVILKFRIRNIKSYKRKLLEQANEIKEEKVNNALVVVNYRLVLYKINILRIVKKYLERLGLLVIKSLERLSKYSKKECYEFKGLVNELKQVLKKKYCIFWNSVKEFFNKVVLHLQGFYEYCVEQIAILKLKISNKMHHIKSINEFNENIHIEETKDALILVKSGIERFETKLLVRIVVVLKKVIVAVEKAKQRICYKVLYAFKENSKKGQKKNRPLFAVRAKKEPTPNCPFLNLSFDKNPPKIILYRNNMKGGFLDSELRREKNRICDDRLILYF